MEAVLCERDVERLKSLIDKYEGQEDVYETAKTNLFDHFMALRTSLVIEMRNITWAYKYYALKYSRVILDVLKSTAEYRQDKLAIKQDIDNADAATSGLYQDVQDDQILSFTSPRQVRNFSYELLASGETGDIWDHADEHTDMQHIYRYSSKSSPRPVFSTVMEFI
ncbi:hypothetical protein F4813DRAFT_385684 [Daldinia decipiens]|uniref:uncharacterized protein n=1 Tax=Daldinia decipiens TaxID=326647 RepID=UPI0020C58A6C|nr:uncharacterized protein F4813DRAFT_385684 [Daldinia decipiens]KAI1661148.1 hypothetical protein F4813DRAFT_385684 [Daldinia decipiens]